MARILPKLNFDLGAAGGILSEFADVYHRDKSLEASIEQERQRSQQGLDKLSIETYGTPGLFEMDETGSADFVSDLFVDQVNQATGIPSYDYSGMSEADRNMFDEEILNIHDTYSKLPAGPDKAVNKALAIKTAHSKKGLSPVQELNPKYASSIVLDETGKRPLTLSERGQQRDIKGQKEIQDMRGNQALEQISESKGWDYNIMKDRIGLTGAEDRETILTRIDAQLKADISKMDINQDYDLEKMAKQFGYSTSLLESEWDLRKDVEKMNREFEQMGIDKQLNWEEEREGLRHRFDMIKMDKKHGMNLEFQKNEFSHVEMLHDKSFENEKVMKSLDQTYNKELKIMGFNNAKEMQKLGFENSWEAMKYLEASKRSNIEYEKKFDSAQKLLFYNLMKKDAIEKEGRDKVWWKEMEKYKKGMKAEAAAKMTVAGMPDLVFPLATKTGEWESSWMGFDEGDWLDKLDSEFLQKAKAGGGQALVDMAEVEPDNPLVQLYLDNINHVLETMGAPKTPDGEWDDSTLGWFGNVDFQNWSDFDKKKATRHWETLLSLKLQVETAQGK
tara:strand:- start:6753 stop:8432 length:1680 start_codon:yes stop_codon:yes gene_type:complete